MSDDDNKNNVVDLFSKSKKKQTDYKKVSALVDNAIHDLYDALSDEDKEQFKEFLWESHPDIAVKLLGNNDQFIEDIQIDVDKIAEQIAGLETAYQGTMASLTRLLYVTAGCYADLENSNLEYLNEALNKVLEGYDSIKR